MDSPWQIIKQGVISGVLAAVVGAGAFLFYVAWYTSGNHLLPGVILGGTPVGGLTPVEARRLTEGSPIGRRSVTASGASVTVSHTARLRWSDKVWTVGSHEAISVPDVSGGIREALRIGRSGTVLHRAWIFLAGIVHGHYVPVEPRLRERPLSERLREIALEVNAPAREARYDFETNTVTESAAGREVDVAATLDALRDAFLSGSAEVDLVVHPVQPQVASQDLTDARQNEIASFKTPILVADSGRVHNIGLAVKKISGTFLKPGDLFSFNNLVGPRDAAHGWAQAKELYQGEFVTGYGGGICQVSSTLYNAVLLAGLEVKERYHHDRPLQYVSPGRDATVAWNVLDFKFRNSTKNPILIGARIIPGTPQQIEVSLYAPVPMTEGTVRIEDAEIRYHPPAMIETFDPMLGANQRIVVDEGYYGIELKVYRVFVQNGHERRELVSHDVYRPKAGKVKVGVGNEPGRHKLLDPGLQ